MTAGERSVASSTRSIAGATSWSLAAEAARLVGSTASFLLISRRLGPADYGLMAAILAIVTTISPFANLGAPLLLTQRIKRDQMDREQTFRTATGMTLTGAAGFTIITAVALQFVLDPPLVASLILPFVSFALNGILQLCTGLAIACDDIRWYSAITVFGSGTVIMAAVIFSSVGKPTIVNWCVVSLVANLICVALVLKGTAHRFHVGVGWGAIRKSDAIQGFPYSASIAAFAAQDGADKPFMVRYGWTNDSGLYAAAYRVSTLAFVPVQALIVANLGRTFEAGRDGVAGSLKLAKRLLPAALTYSSLACACIMIGAPLFSPLLGESFGGAVEILRWCAFLPLVRTLQFFPANVLMGAGYQPLRLKLLLGMLGLNLSLCVAFIPDHSWRGALLATFVAESAYALTLWIAVRALARREARELKTVRTEKCE